MKQDLKYRKLLLENERLQSRLQEAEDTLWAIRQGEIDALVVKAEGGSRVYTLKGAEHTYRVIIESMNEGAITFDNQGTIIYCNKSFAEMVATPLEKVIGAQVSSFISPKDLLRFSKFLSKVRREFKSAYYLESPLLGNENQDIKIELNLLGLNKSTIPVLLSLTPLKLDQSDEGLSMIITNLTEQKRNEEVLAQERLSAQKLIHEQEIRIQVEKLLEELKLERNRLECEIEKRKELERQKDEFISIASHELKTPVTTIKSYTQILQAQLKEQEKPSMYLSKMNSQVDRLTSLITDLLDVSKIQAGKLKLQKEEFNIEELVKDISDDIQYEENQHKIKINSNISNISVLADRYRISQVLINLISNAIKYSPQAKKVVITLSSDNQNVTVKIKDFGIGISKSDQKKVFERFFQAKNDVRQSYSGLGLGLYISSEIIRQHQGSMWVESQKGKGTTFAFSLIHSSKYKNGKLELKKHIKPIIQKIKSGKKNLIL